MIEIGYSKKRLNYRLTNSIFNTVTTFDELGLTNRRVAAALCVEIQTMDNWFGPMKNVSFPKDCLIENLIVVCK